MIALLSRDAGLYSTRVIRQAFEKAGHDVMILDALQLEIKIGSGVYLNGEKLNPSMVVPRFSPNILLAGLAVIREWEREGVPILNSSVSLAVAHDQLRTLQALSVAGLPIPVTSFCSQPEGSETLDSLTTHSPNVIKLLDSSQGKGVTLAPDRRTARSLLSTLSTLRSSGITQKFYSESEGCDLRLLVFKGAVIKAIKRRADKNDFRANLHQGATMEAYAPTQDECLVALQATEALGLDFAGVDLLPTSQGCLVLEVNASPGLEGVEMGEEQSIAKFLPEALK